VLCRCRRRARSGYYRFLGLAVTTASCADIAVLYRSVSAAVTTAGVTLLDMHVCRSVSSTAPMAAKRAKLRHLVACGIPDAKLVDVIRRLRADSELLEGPPITTQALKRALDELWHQVGYIEQLPSTKAGSDPFQWQCAALPKLLQLFCKESPGFQRALRHIFEASGSPPSSPLSLIFYGDEVVPGNVLRLDNKRKIFAVYVSVLQFGPALLKHDVMWMPVALIRSRACKNVAGGISACVKALFRRWFLVDKIHSDGVLLDLNIPGSRFATVYFKLGSLVADGDALRAIWSSKGASGKLPCIVCKNVVNDDVRSDYFVPLSCANPSLFDYASNADVWGKADVLHARRGAGTKRAFLDLQMLHGLTYNPNGLLWDDTLRPHVRPAEIVTYDAMHVLVANGIVQVETAELLRSLKASGVNGVQALRSFVEADWHFCKALGKTSILRGVFAPAREEAWNSGGDFKAGASEMLLSFPIILHFLFTVIAPMGLLAPQIASYEALGRVLTLVRLGKEGEAVHNHLAEAIAAHARLFAVAYPRVDFKPKHHYAHHVPDQLRRHGIILDAFVGERKHSSIKQCATAIENTKSFECSVLMRVLSKQLDDLLRAVAFENCLVSPRTCDALATLQGCDSAYISATVHYGGTLVSVGDAVFLDDIVHVIKACVRLDESFASCVDVYSFTDKAYVELNGDHAQYTLSLNIAACMHLDGYLYVCVCQHMYIHAYVYAYETRIRYEKNLVGIHSVFSESVFCT